MKHTTDVHVELVKFVDGLSRTYVPQHTVVQYQVVSGVEGGTVPLVVVSQVRVVESQSYLPCLDVINLANRSTEREHSLFDFVFFCICYFKMYSTYTCYMFLCPDDTILWTLTELHIMITEKGMPEDNKSNISHLIKPVWVQKVSSLKLIIAWRHCRTTLNQSAVPVLPLLNWADEWTKCLCSMNWRLQPSGC